MYVIFPSRKTKSIELNLKNPHQYEILLVFDLEILRNRVVPDPDGSEYLLTVCNSNILKIRTYTYKNHKQIRKHNFALWVQQHEKPLFHKNTHNLISKLQFSKQSMIPTCLLCSYNRGSCDLMNVAEKFLS